MKTNKKTSFSLSKETLTEFNLTKNEIELLLQRTLTQEEALHQMCKLARKMIENLGVYAWSET